jgi:hypothetical protein
VKPHTEDGVIGCAQLGDGCVGGWNHGTSDTTALLLPCVALHTRVPRDAPGGSVALNSCCNGKVRLPSCRLHPESQGMRLTDELLLRQRSATMPLWTFWEASATPAGLSAPATREHVCERSALKHEARPKNHDTDRTCPLSEPLVLECFMPHVVGRLTGTHVSGSLGHALLTSVSLQGFSSRWQFKSRSHSGVTAHDTCVWHTAKCLHYQDELRIKCYSRSGDTEIVTTFWNS